MLTVRVGDTAIGFCPCSAGMCPAIGVVVTGDPSDLDSGPPISRLGDQVAFPCGMFTIVQGNPRYLDSGLPDTYIGAQCVGAGFGNIVTANPMHIQA